MLAYGVHLGLHLEVLVFDAQVVSFVELLEHIGALEWHLGYALVDFTHFSVEVDLDVLQL